VSGARPAWGFGLLPIGFARPWGGRHDDARLRAVDPRFPRVAGLDETTALQLEGVLTHVPDVAVLVLGVPIEGPFHRGTVLGDRVPNDRRPDAEDHLRPVSHDLD